MEHFESPYLDFNKEIRIKEQHLILWDQIGKIQHATFHLNDSIPVEERKYLKSIKESFLKLNPKPWDPDTQKRYYRLIGKRQDTLLDKGLGKCFFRNPDLRKILEDSIKSYHENSFFLISCVIMPNHVHMLLIMEPGLDIEKVLGNLKRYVATAINKKIGRKGEMWYKENYCRLMRSKEHYNFTLSYIKENPKYLHKGEFSYWENI